MILKKRKSIKYILSKIKINKPIIYFVTNYVTANDCANICLAIGASPIMADEKLEAGEITQIADAIVINTGTLNQFTFDAMKIVCSVANQRHIPIILDPCGVGCSSFRNECIKTLITKYKFHAIRGNLSEIAFIQSMLSQDCNAIKHQNRGGVDSHITMNEKQKSQMAIQLAQQLSCVICISGKIDIITDGKNIQYCNAGNNILQSITGTGCMLTAVIACFCSAEQDYLKSTFLACEFFGKNAKKFLYSKIKSIKKINKV